MNRYKAFGPIHIFLLSGALLMLFCPSVFARFRSTKRKSRAEAPSITADDNNINARSVKNPFTAEPFSEPQYLAPAQGIVDPPHLLPRQFASAQEIEEETKHLEQLEFEETDLIEFQFQDAELINLVRQIEEIFDYRFITPDMLQPLPANTKGLAGNKITFKTYKPLLREEAWNLFLLFLKIAGFSLVKQTDNMYRIETIDQANKAPLTAYIGVDYRNIPDTEDLIRYVYFVENGDLNVITSIVDSLKSPSAKESIKLQDNKGFLLTDHAHNIRAIMQIVTELDKVTIPQAMSVLKLQRANADDVKKLYDSLNPAQTQQNQQLFGQRKQTTAAYFSEDLKVFVEPRTNSLILLGSKDSIGRLENFIVKHVDIELDQPYSPLYPVHLKFADATVIANIMNEMAKFGKNTEAGKAGGVRAGDKFMRPMVFIAEKETNTIIVKGDYADYLIAKQIIDELDEAQPQVAFDVLILSISASEARELGTQLRTKNPGSQVFGNNIKFQTSGLRAGSTPRGIQTDPTGPGVDRLLGNMLNLIVNPLAGPGNTILTLGQDFVEGALSVWGIFQALQSITNAQLVANPFIVATNNTRSVVEVGETRRVTSSQIFTGVSGQTPQSAFRDDEANLSVTITPQINSDGMIILEIDIVFDQFTDLVDLNSGTKNTRNIHTKVTVANEEILALGGFIRSRVEDDLTKTPVLGDVPILGWLFKNKRKSVTDEHLLILISSKIIEPERIKEIDSFTDDRVAKYYNTLTNFDDVNVKIDPIDRNFFDAGKKRRDSIDRFIFERRQRNKDILQSYSRHVHDGEEMQANGSNNRLNEAPVPQAVLPIQAQESRLSRTLQKKRPSLFAQSDDPPDPKEKSS